MTTPLRPDPADAPFQVGDPNLSGGQLQQLFQHFSAQRQRGAPLSWINTSLRQVTNGRVQSMMQLARQMEMAGAEQQRAENANVPMLEGLARSATMGATLGLAPAIQGVAYGQDVQRMELQRNMGFTTQHPVASGVAEMAGGLLPGMVAGAATLAPASLGGKVVMGALTGGAMGGTQSTMDGGSPAEIIANTAIGAVTGPMAAFASPLTRRVTGSAGLARESGTQIARGIGIGRPQAARMAGQVDAMNQTLLRAGAPPVARVADLSLGQQALGVATRHSGTAAELAEETLTRRAEAAPQLLEDIIGNVMFGGPRPRQTTTQAARTLRQTRRQVARQVYGPLEGQAPADMDAAIIAIGDLQGSPSFRSIWRSAERTAQERGRRLVPLPSSPDQLAADPAAMPDFTTFQSIRQAMSERVTLLFRAGKGNEATALQERLTNLDDHLGRLFPDYPAANAEYRRQLQIAEAPLRGKRLWQSDDPNDVRDWLASAPPEAKQAFREAAADELRRRARSTPRGRNPVQRVIDASGNLGQDKLALVFTPDELTALTDATGTMRRLWRTQRIAMSGSQTAERQAQDAAAGLTHPARLPASTRWAAARAADPVVHAEWQNRTDLGAPWLTRGLLSEGAEQAAFLAQLQQGRLAQPYNAFDLLPFAAATGAGRPVPSRVANSDSTLPPFR